MNIQDFFNEHPRVALAFSGGVDSSYLFYACAKYAGEFRAYYVRSQFQPEFEYQDALQIAKQLGHEMTVIELDVLADPQVAANPGNRCYYCKQRIMGDIQKKAKEDGFDLLIDGTNASDDAGDRPGMRALQEMQVLSPLRICGITKAEVRALSSKAGLPTWNKPAYACLATRIPVGDMITAEKLLWVEKSENFLFSLGFSDIRVRVRGENALLQITQEQLPLEREHHEEICRELGAYFAEVMVDPTPREKSR